MRAAFIHEYVQQFWEILKTRKQKSQKNHQEIMFNIQTHMVNWCLNYC